MAFRQRTPTFRPQLSVRRVYETLQPRSEMKETPEAYLLHVYLPGFSKDRIKITFVDSARMVRITGERPIEGSHKWRKFDQTYTVPENSETESLEARFELGTLILKMQKKVTSQVAPKQELQTTQEKDATEAKPEKAQETIPPQTTTTKVEEPIEDKKIGSLQSPIKGPSEFKAQEGIQEDTSSKIPQESIRDHGPQKGQEEVVPKPTTSTTFTKDETEEKIQEEMRLKTLLAKVKEQLEEKEVGNSAEDDKKKEESKKEVKEEDEKPSDSRKPVDKGDSKEKEIKTRELSTKEAEPSAEKVVEKGKESSSRTSPNQEGKSGEDMINIVGNGIKNLVTSSSQVVTKIAEGKLNDEEKHLVRNIGAAVLMIAAWGAYVSYRFSS